MENADVFRSAHGLFFYFCYVILLGRILPFSYCFVALSSGECLRGLMSFGKLILIYFDCEPIRLL